MRGEKCLQATTVPRCREALLLVDVINAFNFDNAHTMLPRALDAAHRIAWLKERLLRRGGAAIYANDNYGVWDSEFSDILGHCRALPGHRGEMARLLTPGRGELVILKPQHSAFNATPLQHLLTRMQVERLIIVGFSTDICVMLSATDARMAGYAVWVPQDCTAAESAQRKQYALQQLQQAFKCSTYCAGRPPPGPYRA